MSLHPNEVYAGDGLALCRCNIMVAVAPWEGGYGAAAEAVGHGIYVFVCSVYVCVCHLSSRQKMCRI